MLSIPVIPFETLAKNITTNTITVPLNTTFLNLKALFLLIPVKNMTLNEGETLKVKSGKIVYPKYFNIPGEIISARYMNEVRGFIRSAKKAFPTSITMDIGTSVRILSIKFSQTIEITGADGFDNAKEAVMYILDKIHDIVRHLDTLHSNLDVVEELKTNLWEPQQDPHTKHVQDAMHFFLRDRGSDEDALEFLEQFVLKFNGKLYDGDLTLGEFTSEMLNIAFDLGFVVNQKALADKFNEPPFYTFFNNVSSSIKVRIEIPYVKFKKGEEKIGFDYIKVNRSGYILMIGHSLDSMCQIYYTFFQRVFQHLDAITSPSKYTLRTNVINEGSYLQIEDYRLIRSQQEQLRRQIITGNVPLLEDSRLLQV